MNYKSLFFDNLEKLEENLYDVGQEIKTLNPNSSEWKMYSDLIQRLNIILGERNNGKN